MKLKFRPVSFLKPKNINKNQNNQTISPIKYQYNLSSDTISFSGKSLVQQVKDLEKDAFLSDGLREYILSYIDDKNNLIDLHKEYYASLLNCKTLDEAKELYPEFRDVVDLKDVDLSSISFYAPKQIAKGQIEGLNKENASLVFLKKYIGELIPLNNIGNEDYFHLNNSAIKKILKFLNISMNDNYESLITKNRKSEAAKARWQDEEFREKTLKSLNSPETKAKLSEAAKARWQDEEFREKTINSMNSPEAKAKHSEAAKSYWQDDEMRLRQSEVVKARWQDDEFREKTINSINSPEIKARQSEAAKARWQDKEFREKTLKSLNSPEIKARQSEATKARWQDKEFREKTLKSLNSPETKAKHAKNSSEKRIKVIQENIKIIATKLAFNQSPETQQIYQETLEKDPRFKNIISKAKSGLTHNKIRYVNMCLEEMSQKYPEEIQKVKEIQSQILFDWGFYDENTNFEKLVEQAQKLDPDNKNNRKQLYETQI